jgi:outer membrane protein TolC
VESAYQSWRASAERLPQVSALPDPRLGVGFFLDEVETRVGAQQAVLRAQQTFPWPGELSGREDAAAQAARASWRRFEGVRLEVTEQVVSALHDLAYLDAAIRISRENLDLLRSFEEVVRARYRVGAGSHPELIKVQVELGQLEDRVAQLRAMRPSYVAQLNAVLNRDADAPVPEMERLPDRTLDADPAALVEQARRSNPSLLALDDQAEEQQYLAEVARKQGLPDVTVGLDYFLVDDAQDSSIPESGDDPILLSFGVTVPLWRDKYRAGVREALSRRLSISFQRASEANRIAAALHRAWFEHTDADRRVRLYEQTLIPKAEESLQASLAGFRTGQTSFLDLLDTERTLLEFALAAERARADRGKALAVINRLVGAEAQAPAEVTGGESEETP